jgi:hypothetical protein
MKLYSRPHCSEDALILIYEIEFTHFKAWPTEGAMTETKENCYIESPHPITHLLKRALYLSNIASETGCTEIEITGKTLTVERLTFWTV